MPTAAEILNCRPELAQPVFDVPVTTNPAGELGRAGVFSGETGDRISDLGCPSWTVAGAGDAGDPECLAGMRKPDTGGDGDSLDPARPVMCP